MRSVPFVNFVNNEYYHVFNRSIAGFKIFNDTNLFNRFIELINYYRFENNYLSYSRYLESSQSNLANNFSGETIVDIIAYCIMPTHFHLLVKQNIENGIIDFVSKIENSYSKYFNTIHKRKGPLWEGRFSSVHVKTDEQLLHLTRYIHLNPSSAGLVKKPEQWKFSSLNEYLHSETNESICNFKNVISLNKIEYQNFINDRIHLQKELSIIKAQLIDSYSG